MKIFSQFHKFEISGHYDVPVPTCRIRVPACRIRTLTVYCISEKLVIFEFEIKFSAESRLIFLLSFLEYWIDKRHRVHIRKANEKN